MVAPAFAQQAANLGQGFTDAAGADGELGKLMPSLAIDEDKILSIQASKSGTGVSITDAGRSAGCWCSRGASANNRSGVLLQPAIQLSDTSRHSLPSFE